MDSYIEIGSFSKIADNVIGMLKRLPKPQDALQVYAVIAVMLSGWTITAFLWKLSAWLLLLNMGEIFTLFSYALVTNLIESLSVLLLLLMACALLPPRLFRDHFVVRGTILSVGLIGSLMLFVRFEMQFGIESGVRLLIAPLAVLLLTSLILGLPPKFRLVSLLHSAALWLSDRMTIFLFLLVPLFLIVLAYVTFRNII